MRVNIIGFYPMIPPPLVPLPPGEGILCVSAAFLFHASIVSVAFAGYSNDPRKNVDVACKGSKGYISCQKYVPYQSASGSESVSKSFIAVAEAPLSDPDTDSDPESVQIGTKF